MDIAKIRALLGECFKAQEDPRDQSAEEDYHEAVLAIRALKSLFDRELDSRTVVLAAERVAPHDRALWAKAAAFAADGDERS